MFVLGAEGCSTFPRDFTAAVAKPVPAETIEGPWQGSWNSNGGHSGQLRCLLEPSGEPAGGAENYQARFEAKFWGIFTARYNVILHGTRGDGGAKLSGDHDLGWLAGGVYHYEADVTPAAFEATYRSKYDTGTFHMTRPV